MAAKKDEHDRLCTRCTGAGVAGSDPALGSCPHPRCVCPPASSAARCRVGLAALGMTGAIKKQIGGDQQGAVQAGRAKKKNAQGAVDIFEDDEQ
eukprot:gene44599-10053_t